MVPFYLLGKYSARDCSLSIWSPPCLLFSSHDQEQGPCFSQANRPTACFLLLLEAELWEKFRRTWSYLQKVWEQVTCFHLGFWLAIHWCGWRPPPLSQLFPTKGQASNIKEKKQKTYLERKFQSNLKILSSIVSHNTDQLLIIILNILTKINLKPDI